MEGITGFRWNTEDWRLAQRLASQVKLEDGRTLWERVESMDSVWALHEIKRVLASRSLDKS